MGGHLVYHHGHNHYHITISFTSQNAAFIVKKMKTSATGLLHLMNGIDLIWTIYRFTCDHRTLWWQSVHSLLVTVDQLLFLVISRASGIYCWGLDQVIVFSNGRKWGDTTVCPGGSVQVCGCAGRELWQEMYILQDCKQRNWDRAPAPCKDFVTI